MTDPSNSAALAQPEISPDLGLRDALTHPHTRQVTALQLASLQRAGQACEVRGPEEVEALGPTSEYTIGDELGYASPPV
jgi:hypothetical protein